MRTDLSRPLSAWLVSTGLLFAVFGCSSGDDNGDSGRQPPDDSETAQTNPTPAPDEKQSDADSQTDRKPAEEPLPTDEELEAQSVVAARDAINTMLAMLRSNELEPLVETYFADLSADKRAKILDSLKNQPASRSRFADQLAALKRVDPEWNSDRTEATFIFPSELRNEGEPSAIVLHRGENGWVWQRFVMPAAESTRPAS